MPGDTLGQVFRVTNWGESHGPAIGAVVEGCPPRLPLDESDLQPQLDRRAPGQSSVTTARRETDLVRILSGVFEGRTTGAPICLQILNQDARSGDYDALARVCRPGHADFTMFKKYGCRDHRGGGRSSARQLAGTVAAGAVARKILSLCHATEIVAWTECIGPVRASIDPERVVAAEAEGNPVRCPDPVSAMRMQELIEEVRRDGDSLGGVVGCVVRNIPVGLGEPVYDRLEADLAKAVLAINASRGVEFGVGFASASMRGSQHNDPFVLRDGQIRPLTNKNGGVLGGISTGNPLVLRVAFKPTPTIGLPQRTVDLDGNEVELAARGRHDPCVCPRAVPVVEAMVALVLCDHLMRQRAQNGNWPW